MGRAAANDATASATDASARDTEHSESESDSAGDSAAHNPSKREAPSSGGEGDRSSQALSS